MVRIFGRTAPVAASRDFAIACIGMSLLIGTTIIGVAPGARVYGSLALADTIASNSVPSTAALVDSGGIGSQVPQDPIVNAEVAFIESAQLADGAIPIAPGANSVDPYQSGYAAMGLACASNTPGAAPAAWRWLAWYQANEGEDGIVSAATVVGGSTLSTGTEDSTDATAGVFLMTAIALWASTGDITSLRSISSGIAGAVKAIESTQVANGLTWSRPNFQVAYLMDEAEVYGGLSAAVGLAGVLGDPALSARAAEDAAKVSAGVASLWDPATNAYDWALHDGGPRQSTDWSILYPDAMEQMWAVAFGLVPQSRAADLVNEFAAAQPSWAQPTALGKERGSTAGVFSSVVSYWPLAALAFSAVGQTAQAASAEASIGNAATSASDVWPYSPAISGELIVGQETMPFLP